MGESEITGSKPKVVKRVVSAEMFVHTYDVNDRQCWDSTAPERVVLVKDLRAYGVGLHIGQLGWSVPESTDGYKSIEVIFDSGQRLLVSARCIECVEPVDAATVSARLIAERRNTRFDADTAIAHQCRQEWIRKYYEPFLSIDGMAEGGEGSQEVYAYTFPSLRDLATKSGDGIYPVKIGYSANEDGGALYRIRAQIIEPAAYPERPIILVVWRAWDGRVLEQQVHHWLRELNRTSPHRLGKEWFLTNKEELLEFLVKWRPSPRQGDKPIKGADETLDEMFYKKLSEGSRVEFSMDPETAAVRMTIRPMPQDKKI